MNLIRTRFAPSPTGFLHVGGLRTALYNYLFARHNQGQMILRIEDTDQARYVDGATENLIKTLHIMDIDYQEGPDKEGQFGPYLQSQRLDLYRQHAQVLVQNGNAYFCFCTPERLETLRREQEASGQQPKYDGLCRKLSDAEVQKKLKENIPHVIRLKMPTEGESTFSDLIRGEVTIRNDMVDDQILVKSDGYPTYHLANVVDDHFMEISHVIRGEEWLLSVPKHLRLYQAFGWTPPQMAHLPLLLNPDRTKLSKRQGDVAVEDFLQKGYLPEALNNFVALLGWNPGNDQEIFSMQELIDQFSLERVNKSGAVFDLAKLNWMNGQYLREIDETRRNQFLLSYLKKAGFNTADLEKSKKIISAVYQRISFGDEIKSKAAIFFSDRLILEDDEAREILRKPAALAVLKAFLEKISPLDKIDIDSFRNLMKDVQEETGIKKQDLWMPIRVAITGVTHGPELPMVMEIFGKKKIENFVRQAIEIAQDKN
jgi:nondiscriminating glutamyl-tRNA synthetase